MTLGKRGKKLFKALTPEGTSDATAALATEAARIADRLDELDRIIAGKGVLELMQFRRMDQHGNGSEDEPIVVQVKFDNVLSEARQQASALNTLLKTLGLDAAASGAKPAPKGGAQPADTAGGGGMDDIAARRAERERQRQAASQN